MKLVGLYDISAETNMARYGLRVLLSIFSFLITFYDINIQLIYMLRFCQKLQLNKKLHIAISSDTDQAKRDTPPIAGKLLASKGAQKHNEDARSDHTNKRIDATPHIT